MAINTSYSTPANGTDAIYSLITLLTANGWVIPAWSDGTTLTTPGSPLTANPYGSSSSGANNLGNTFAWFRITSPTVGGNTREWLFQRGAADETWTVARGRSGFTTGGNATTVPTDPTATTLLIGQLFDATLASRLLLAVDTVCGAWTMLTIVSGGGNVRTFVSDEALATGTYPAADADPYLYALYYDATGINVSAFSQPGGPVTFYKRTRQGLTFAANSPANLQPIFPYGAAAYAPPSNASTQIAPEPYGSTEVPIQIPVFKPGPTSTGTGWCGFTSGLRWATVWGRANGQTLTDTTNFWVYVGGLWCPWDSSTPTI